MQCISSLLENELCRDWQSAQDTVGGNPQPELLYTHLNMCVCQSVAMQCNAVQCLRVCVCVFVNVLASSTALVMLRQTVSGCVYFWVSDSVSMAADASERKALRYKQTLVSVLPLSSSSFSSASSSSTVLLAPPACLTFFPPLLHLVSCTLSCMTHLPWFPTSPCLPHYQ